MVPPGSGQEPLRHVYSPQGLHPTTGYLPFSLIREQRFQRDRLAVHTGLAGEVLHDRPTDSEAADLPRSAPHVKNDALVPEVERRLADVHPDLHPVLLPVVDDCAAPTVGGVLRDFNNAHEPGDRGLRAQPDYWPVGGSRYDAPRPGSHARCRRRTTMGSRGGWRHA